MKTPHGISFRLALISSALFLSACSPGDPQGYLEAAQQQSNENNFDAAVIELKSGVADFPTDGSLRIALADAYMAQGKAMEAAKEYQKAIDLLEGQPTADLLQKTATALFFSNQFDSVLQMAEPLTQCDELDCKLVLIQSAKYVRHPDLLEHEAALEGTSWANAFEADVDSQLIGELEASSDVQKAVKAGLLLQHGEPTQAVAILNPLLESKPSLVSARLNLIQGLMATNDHASAETQITMLREAGIKNAQLDFYQAGVAFYNEDYDAATTYGRAALNAGMRPPSVRLIVGLSEFYNENYEAAIAQLNIAKSSFPADHPVNDIIVAAMINLGDFEGAADFIVTQEDASIENLGSVLLNMRNSSPEARQNVLETIKEYEVSSPQDTLKKAISLLAVGDREGVELLNTNTDMVDNVAANLALISYYSRSGEQDKALQLLREWQTKAPESVLPLNVEAHIHLQNKDLEKAKAALERIKKIEPDHYSPALFDARYALAQGDYPKAKDIMLSSLRKYPLHGPTLELLLKASVSFNQPGDAIAPLKSAVDAAGKTSPHSILLAMAYTSAGDMASADATLSAMDEDQVKDSLQYWQLRALVAEKHEGQEALNKVLTRWLEAKPDLPQAYSIMAELKLRQNKPQDAITTLQDGISKVRYPDGLRDKLVQLYLANGSTELARSQIQQLNNEHQKAFYQITILQRNGKLNDALIEAKALYDDFKTTRSAHIYSSLIAAVDGRKAAIGFLKSHLAEYAKHADMHFHIADYYIAEKNYSAAKQHLEEFLKVSKPNRYVLNNLAWVELQLGETEQAQQHAEQAYQRDPMNPAIVDTLLEVLIAAKDKQRASAVLQEYKSNNGKMNTALNQRQQAITTL